MWGPICSLGISVLQQGKRSCGKQNSGQTSWLYDVVFFFFFNGYCVIVSDCVCTVTMSCLHHVRKQAEILKFRALQR